MTQYRQIIEKQRSFFNSGKTMDIDFRINALKKLKQTIESNYDEIIEAVRKDFRKSEFETAATEILGVIEEIKAIEKNLHSWAKPKKVKTPVTFFKASSKVYYQPFGNVLVIGAWNYPILLILSPAIGAIGAGNCCVLKPSELAPNTSKLIVKLIKESFDEAHCTVVEGGAQETTLLLEEKFDFIHYTGSSRVGRIVAEAAAKHLTPTILELGGKSPCIVDTTADIDVSARRICWGKFVNAGQTCVAPDYVYVHKSIKDKFIAAMRKQISEFYGNDAKKSPDYCRIINERHFERLSKLLVGEEIIIGGNTDKADLYIEPTVVEPASWDRPVMQEEIFGPILPVFEYEDLTEVIRIVNSKERPLSCYIFSEVKKTQKRIINEIAFGGGCINTTLMHIGNINIPFGGIGNSGMGYYHGIWSFESFSHKKGIMNKSVSVDIKMLYPPYKDRIKLLKRLL